MIKGINPIIKRELKSFFISGFPLFYLLIYLKKHLQYRLQIRKYHRTYFFFFNRFIFFIYKTRR